MMRSWIGTSGFQYPEWKGKFFPEKISPKQMLPYYAERFDSTESNYSFRTIPSEKTIANWGAATPAEFCFSFKAPQRVTHFAKLRDCMATVEALHTVIAPLGAKLGAVLFQLPPTFKKDLPVLADFLAGLPGGLRVAFEFRHASWFDDEVFACLQSQRAALCIAENETLLTPSVATAPFGYLRLRREDYTKAQIEQWADWVHAQSRRWSEAFIYFKHEEKAVGPRFAQQMQKALHRAS